MTVYKGPILYRIGNILIFFPYMVIQFGIFCVKEFKKEWLEYLTEQRLQVTGGDWKVEKS